MNLAQTNHDALWQDNIRRYGERGYYDVESFRGSSAQAEIFLNLAEAFADRGADILIVLMPEHSLLRERIPVSAMDSMTKPLNRRFGNDSPVVVDLRESVADSGFADISHLNSSGRKSFGPIFADAVARRAREAAQ